MYTDVIGALTLRGVSKAIILTSAKCWIDLSQLYAFPKKENIDEWLVEQKYWLELRVTPVISDILEFKVYHQALSMFACLFIKNRSHGKK